MVKHQRYIKCKSCKYNIIQINEIDPETKNEKAVCVRNDGQPYEYIFDLKDVDTISSCFVTSMIQIKRVHDDNKIKIINANNKVKEILKILGIDQIMSIE